jgi:hypothetical protein
MVPDGNRSAGGDLRIHHALGELTGASYGRVVSFYTRSRVLQAVNEPLVEEVMKEREMKSYLTAPQRKALGAESEAISADLRQAFEQAFQSWKLTWFSGGLAVNSNLHSRAVGKEYDALIALGPEILPHLVEKLAEPENFLALQLYDAMQPKERLVIHFESDDERILEGEQGRARRVVPAWFANR